MREQNLLKRLLKSRTWSDFEVILAGHLLVHPRLLSLCKKAESLHRRPYREPMNTCCAALLGDETEREAQLCVPDPGSKLIKL